MKNKFKPLERIDALPEEQRHQLADWLLTVTLKKTGELLKEEFGVEIPRSTLNRFRKRCELADYLDTSDESPTARAELINAAASGKTNFSQATVQLLEKQAFELAHATRDDDNLGALKDLFVLINGHKNTTTRSRLAAVQEQKAKLREQELELKKSQLGGTRVSRVNSGLSPEALAPSALSDSLGPLALSLEDIKRRAGAKFGLRPSVAAPSESAADSHLSTDPQTEKEQTTDNSPSATQNPSPSAVENNSSSSSTLPAPGSKLETPSSKPGVSTLEQRVNAYTLARHEEYIEKKDARKVGKWASFKFETALHHCPCGKPVPCPEHGDYPKYFWQICSDCADYMEYLAARKLPYTAPRLLLIEQERTARRAGLPAPDFSNTAAHALARWYSHTPRPRGTPPPDETWTTECPCGKELPCAHHDPLALEVRYLKPWNPDYIGALRREGIPVHTPTPEQIEDMRKGIPPVLDAGRALPPETPTIGRTPSVPDPRQSISSAVTDTELNSGSTGEESTIDTSVSLSPKIRRAAPEVADTGSYA